MIETTAVLISYNGDDTTLEFDFPYMFFSSDELEVSIIAANGDVTPLVLDDDFTVDGEGEPTGGTVTLVDPVATGDILRIIRILDAKQEMQLTNNTAYFLPNIEQAFDKVTMMIQQLNAKLDRAIKRDLTDDGEIPSVDALLDGIPIVEKASYSEVLAGVIDTKFVTPFSVSALAEKAETLSNKRIVPTTTTVASASSITPNLSTSNTYIVTALSQAITINAPTGSPYSRDALIFRIKDNATQRAITWNAIYKATMAALPTTTTTNKTLYCLFLYNAADTKWDLMATSVET